MYTHDRLRVGRVQTGRGGEDHLDLARQKGKTASALFTMNKLFSIICALLGLVLLGLIQPMFDIMIAQAMEEGGLLAVAAFFLLLTMGGATFLFLAVVLWRR